MGCLYRIEFPGGKSYIGITADSAERRFAEHRYNSETNRADRAVNRALRKYGPDSVTLETLVIAEWDYLVALEPKVIAAYGTFGRGGYNMTAGGEGALGYKHTPEALLKMGATHKGNTYRKGKTFSAESRAKMSAVRKGRRLSSETKALIGAASRGNKHCLGRKLSEDHKRRISEANTGKKWSAESRARMSIAATKREAARRLGRAA